MTAVQSTRIRVQAERIERENRNSEQVADLLTELFSVSDADHSRGEAVTARELLGRGAERVERELAGDPEMQARMLDVIGVAYRGLGVYDRSKPLHERGLAVRRGLHAGDDPDVATSMLNLGSVLRFRGEFGSAEVLLREGEAREAKIFLRRASEVSRLVQGSRHPVYALNLTLLADLLRARKALDEAEVMYRQALEIQRDVLPPGHANTASTLLGLGRLLMDRNRLDEAEPMLRDALRMREEVLVANHWGTDLAGSALGACVSLLGRNTEAEPLLLDGFTRLRDTLGIRDLRTQSALRHLVDHYERVGRAGEAATHRAALLAP